MNWKAYYQFRILCNCRSYLDGELNLAHIQEFDCDRYMREFANNVSAMDKLKLELFSETFLRDQCAELCMMKNVSLYNSINHLEYFFDDVLGFEQAIIDLVLTDVEHGRMIETNLDTLVSFGFSKCKIRPYDYYIYNLIRGYNPQLTGRMNRFFAYLDSLGDEIQKFQYFNIIGILEKKIKKIDEHVRMCSGK